jgi:hypothetical protein
MISLQEYKDKCVELARALQLIDHLKGQLRLQARKRVGPPIKNQGSSAKVLTTEEYKILWDKYNV